MFPFLLLFIGLVFIILVFSVFYLDETFVYISSMMVIIIGVYVMIYGLLDINNWFVKSLSTVFMGIGLYTLVTTALNSIE